MPMAKTPIGGILHTYQKYDPGKFPSPTQPPPDMVTPMMEHLLKFGSFRSLSEEEMARAVKIDPSQIQGMGPSLDFLRAMLLERKRKILEKYETESVQALARSAFHDGGGKGFSSSEVRTTLSPRDPRRATLRSRTVVVRRRQRYQSLCAASGEDDGAPGGQVSSR